MILYFFLIPLVPVLLLFFFLYIKEKRAISKIYNVKDGSRPYCVSVFSTFYFLLFGRKDETLVHYEARNSKDKGPVVLGFQFFQDCIYVRSPDLATYVLKNPKLFEKTMPPFFKELKEFIGKTQVLMANGHDWQKQRKILDPAFVALQNYEKIFDAKSKLVVKRLEQGRVNNINLLVQKMALDVLGLSIFGYDFDSLSDKIEKNLEAYTILMELMNSPSKILYYFVKELVAPCLKNTELQRALDTFHNLIEKCIVESKKSQTKNISMLDMMLASSQHDDGLTDIEIRDNLKIFFIAGHETTANALSFALQNLAEYPNIQENIRKDLQNSLKDHEFSYEAYKNNESLNNFVKENLRMFPPGAVVPIKKCTEDTQIGDWIVPKGMNVSIQIYDIHYSKEIYGDPENFRPDRWKKEESKKYPFGSWMPFSMGPRVCIGNEFSLMEQRILLANIILNFKISKVNPKDYPQVDSSSTLFQAAKNIPLKFESLNKSTI